MGSEGAACFHTLSDEARDLTKEDWDTERFGMVCTKSENFADWKAALLKLCKYAKCTWAQKQQLQNFFARVEATGARATLLQSPVTHDAVVTMPSEQAP